MTKPQKPGRARVVAAVLIAAVVAVSLGACSSEDDVADVTGRQVEIRASGCRGNIPELGSGSAIDADTVLTVAHVVAGADAITVTDRAGLVLAATVVGIDTDLDLAVLDVPGLEAAPASRATLASGDGGTAYGLGTGGDVEWSVERPVTIRIADIYGRGVHDRAGYEIDAAIERGDSGAGLFTEDGRIAGVLFASSRRDDGRAWATAIDVADPLIAAVQADATPSPASVPCVAPCPPQRLTVPPTDDCLP